MKKHIIASTVALTLAGVGLANTAAADASKSEAAGAGTGVVIGAVAGGPPGAIIGAAIGAWIGDKFHRDRETIDALDAKVDSRESDIRALSSELIAQQSDSDRLRQELALVDSSGVRELHAVLERGLTFTVTYRTDDATLPIEVEQRLAGIASLLAVTPGLQVTVDGFADPRGTASYNEALSQMRAGNIKALLVKSGVAAEQVVATGYGESQALVGQVSDPDQLALERKVHVTFQLDNQVGVASLDP
ncbi:MAG: DUF456 family protein [Pseudomonadota bacterium]